MAGTALLGRLTWQLAELVEVVAETPRVKTIVFDVPGWPARLEEGEVSPYLTDELLPGDEIELRGPIGGYWEGGVGQLRCERAASTRWHGVS